MRVCIHRGTKQNVETVSGRFGGYLIAIPVKYL